MESDDAMAREIRARIHREARELVESFTRTADAVATRMVIRDLIQEMPDREVFVCELLIEFVPEMQERLRLAAKDPE